MSKKLGAGDVMPCLQVNMQLEKKHGIQYCEERNSILGQVAKKSYQLLDISVLYSLQSF